MNAVYIDESSFWYLSHCYDLGSQINIYTYTLEIYTIYLDTVKHSFPVDEQEYSLREISLNNF